MPVEVRRCIKMAKSLLGHGRIFICDQSAIRFGNREPQKNLDFLKKKAMKMVVFSILSSFEDLLQFKNTIYLVDGKVSQFSNSLEAIKDMNSPISKFLKKTGIDLYNQLYSEIGPLLKNGRKINHSMPKSQTGMTPNGNSEDFNTEEISFDGIDDYLDEKVVLQDERLKNKK